MPHTGRTIAQARRRIREALGLFVDNAEKAEFIDDVKLPNTARSVVKRVRQTLKRAEKEAAKLQESRREAARVLTSEFGVSIRDAAELLGISHQRIHQLVAKQPGKRKTAGG